MGLRFRKSITLAPGIRMNLSGSGFSWTFGPRGASVSIGKRGTYLNSGIPGTGFYSRSQLSGGGSRAQPQRQLPGPKVEVSISVGVSADGTITFKDSNGNPASEAMIDALKKQKGDALRELIQQECDKINAQVTALGTLHLDMPQPNNVPSYQPQQFDLQRPVAPVPKAPGFFSKFFKSKVKQIAQDNAQAQSLYESDLRMWEAKKAEFESVERKKQELIAQAVSGDSNAMEAFFGEVLQDIAWPRETLVSFEICDQGTQLAFDVDLPEVEDIPNKTATVPARGYKLSVKEMGATAVQKLYAAHVHSIGFRLIGEAFGMLPKVQAVALSGYSQRKSKTTGHEADEYLYSVAVLRSDWAQINFDDLEAIDVIDAFTRFDLRRNMTKTGVFKAIEPF